MGLVQCLTEGYAAARGGRECARLGGGRAHARAASGPGGMKPIKRDTP